jgi:hypothetical protein
VLPLLVIIDGSGALHGLSRVGVLRDLETSEQVDGYESSKLESVSVGSEHLIMVHEVGSEEGRGEYQSGEGHRVRN